jgi:hypothetical protein
MQRLGCSIPALLLTCAMVSGGAAEPVLSGMQLFEYCKAFQTAPRSAEGRICAAYVRGFLDGALVSDVRVQARVVESESWLERARRTRLGTRHVRKFVYCLDPSTPLEQIIGKVVTYAETRPQQDDLPASVTISYALQRFYAC